MTVVGGALILGFLFVVFFQSTPATPSTPRQTITKVQSKTYLKYITLNGGVSPTVPPTATVSPTLAATVTPEQETTPTTGVTGSITPEPTEIILAQISPTEASSSAELTEATEAPAVAQLPTTGIVSGSIVIFMAAFSMLVFAFVL